MSAQEWAQAMVKADRQYMSASTPAAKAAALARLHYLSPPPTDCDMCGWPFACPTLNH